MTTRTLEGRIMIPAQWLEDLQRADIYAITTRIEDQLARMSDEVTLTAIEAEQTLRAYLTLEGTDR